MPARDRILCYFNALLANANEIISILSDFVQTGTDLCGLYRIRKCMKSACGANVNRIVIYYTLIKYVDEEKRAVVCGTRCFVNSQQKFTQIKYYLPQCTVYGVHVNIFQFVYMNSIQVFKFF